MKKLITLFLFATLAASVGWAETVSKTMSEIATANNWATASGNGTQTCYTSFALNDYITISTTGTPNCGSFWGTDWRLYESKNGNVIITAATGCSLQSVTFTYNKYNNGVLKYNNSNVITGTACNISGSTAEFTVSHSSGTSPGQARITAISVTYSTGTAATVQDPTLTDEFTFWPVMNETASATVTITPASGNTVRYTTNGSTPSRTNGTEITAATTINISATTTVKAISYVGTQTSSVVSKTYTQGQTVEGIAAFKGLTSGTTVRLYLPDANNARTLYVNQSKNEAFVRDNTGAICIYNVTTNPLLQWVYRHP